jgi:hypothetical protein
VDHPFTSNIFGAPQVCCARWPFLRAGGRRETALGLTVPDKLLVATDEVIE